MDDKIVKKLTPVTNEEQGFLDGKTEIDRNIYMQNDLNIVNSKKLLAQGKLISMRVHTRFVHFPQHTHDYIEIVYMCCGKTTHIINGQEVLLKKGELLFLSQNSKQEILPAGKDDIAVNFIILPEFFDRALYLVSNENSPLKNYILNNMNGSESNTVYLHYKVADVLPIQNLVENLIYSLIDPSKSNLTSNQITMGLLIFLLIDYSDRVEYANENDEFILKVLKYIDENYKEGSLYDLAEKMNCDFTSLSKNIKQKTGKTYTQLTQEKRLSQAEFLLKNTKLNIDEIALHIGYSNISYFHRLFLKKFNISPSKYRKICNS